MTASKLKAPDPVTVGYNLHRLLGYNIQKPNNLFTLDLETTDVDPMAGVIWQMGYHSVVNGVPSDKTPEGAAVWLKQPADDLRGGTFEIMRRRAAILGEDGNVGNKVIRDKTYREAEDQFISEVQSKGVEPRDAIEAMIGMVNTARAAGCIIAGQNFARFDVPWIEVTAKYFGIDFRFPSDGLLDLGMQIKAGVLGRRILSRESYREFYISVAEIRARGVFYAIERFCIPFFELDTKYGVDTAKAHDAGYDCWITWLALHELIEMVRNAGSN